MALVNGFAKFVGVSSGVSIVGQFKCSSLTNIIEATGGKAWLLRGEDGHTASYPGR